MTFVYIPLTGLIPDHIIISHKPVYSTGIYLTLTYSYLILVIIFPLRKTFSKESLLQFHIFSMIGLGIRYNFSSQKCGQPVESAIYISDMKRFVYDMFYDYVSIV